MVVELLLVVGATATAVCFVRGRRVAGVTGLVLGVAAFAVYIVVGSMLESGLPGLLAAGAYAGGMALVMSTGRAPSGSHASPRPTRGERVRRSVVGLLVGAVPGALVIAVPVALHAMGVITSDESQVAFLGMFLLPVGVLIGGVVGALSAGPGRADATPEESQDTPTPVP